MAHPWQQFSGNLVFRSSVDYMLSISKSIITQPQTQNPPGISLRKYLSMK